MTTESLEELRERLLRQTSVQQMIQVRAYEIYQMRGSQPGGDAQDWFHAESEVLAFLLAGESAAEDENENPVSVAETPAEAPPEKKQKPSKARTSKPAQAKSATTKKPTTKRAAAKKPSTSKVKSNRSSNQGRPEESGQ